MEPHSRHISASGGLGLHLLEWSSEGVALLLLHGFANDAHVWDDFAPCVAPSYRTLALDLRGHGDSEWDARQRYDYEFHLADLEAVCAALDIERVVLVGHSLGGRIATLFAGQHPERMAGLVLVDSGPDLDPRGTTRIRLDLQRSSAEGGSFAAPPEYERALARAYPAASATALARMARHGLRQRADGRYERKTDPEFHAGRRGLTPEQMEQRDIETAARLWAALAALPCPTLVVRGAASDVLSAECADRMVDEVLRAGRLAVIPRAAHSVMLDNPEDFAAAVCDFALG